MPVQAVIATTVTNPVTQVATLFLGGASVLKAPGGSGFGVPIESIEVVEAGPGGVSSMEFTVDDPNKEVFISDGLEVNFWDVTNNVRLFRGYVDHYELHPDFGGQARTIKVSCTGVEVWLDWLPIYPAYAGTNAQFITGAIVNTALQLNGPLIVKQSTFETGQRFAGIGAMAGYRTQFNGPATWTIAAGTTLREFIYQLFTHSEVTAGDGLVQTPVVTVDFDMALRVWLDGIPPGGSIWQQPSDYTTLTINDTVAGTSSQLNYSVELGDAAHEVLIVGFDPASSGLFGDGTGLRGRRLVVTDTTITTAAMAQVRAAAELKKYNATVRGTLTVTDWNPPTTVHAGSLLALTDASVGLAAPDGLRLYDIRKTFLGDGRQTWVASFGGRPPSAVNLLRKLTRSVAA